MKLPRLVVLTLIFTYLSSSAQVTNVRKWRKTEKDSLENGLFLYDEKAYLKALPVFENIYSHHPSEEFIKYVYAKCGLYRSDKHEEAYAIFLDIYQKNKRVEDIQFDLATAAHYLNKFDEALEYINIYLQNKRITPENRKSAEMLKTYILNGKYYFSRPTTARINDLGATINSPDDEYSPAIKADESVMIFTYMGPKSIGGRQNIYLQPDPNGSYMEDVYMSYKLAGEFTTAFPVDSLNTNAPDAAISLSNDGSILFIYKNENDNHGDIYQSELVGDHYAKPKKLRGQVNSYSWDGHCSLSPDGKTLYFSSERGGGNGGKDLYKASLSEDGSWQHAVNLGDSINTPYDEDAPFIHPDGSTLFYSSNGKKSMGGYDVIKATMDPADSTFKKTENLGYPINSTDDDIYFVIAANSETAYYSSGRKGGKGLKDIYQIETHFSGVKPSLYLVKGDILHNGDEVAGTIKVEVSSKNNRVYGLFTSNASNGSYLVSLPVGEKYTLTYSYKDLPVKTLEVDLVGTSGYAEKINTVDFRDVPESVSPARSEPVTMSADAKAKADAEAKAKAEAEARAKAEAKVIADAEAAVKAKAEAAAEAARLKAEADRVAKEKANAASEAAKAKIIADAEAAKARAEAKAKADGEAARAKAEADRIAKEKADAAAEAAKAKAIADAEAAKARAAVKARADSAAAAEAAKAKAVADRIARDRATAKASADSAAAAEAVKARAVAARIARERAIAKARTDSETTAEAIKARAVADRIARERAAAKAKADAEAAAEAIRAKAVADRMARERAEAKEETDRIARERAARAKTEADRQAKEKADAKAEIAAELAALNALSKSQEKKPHSETYPIKLSIAIATRTTAVPTETFAPTADGFVPRTRLHVKAIRYIESYGDITKPDLEFKIQITAFKTERNQAFPELRRYGKIERVLLGDGYTRLYIGGSFKTLRTAFALAKRVVLAGQTDAFVSAFYKGKRLTYEDLERTGIFINPKEKKRFK